MDANHAVQTNKYTCSHAFWCSKHLKNSAFNSHCKPPWGGFKNPNLQAWPPGMFYPWWKTLEVLELSKD